ncbi:hypothetical protein ACJBU6_10402 [Exserohilum turcicum]
MGGYDKPTTSSTSRVINTGSREQTYPPTVQKRRNRFESPTQVTSPEETKHAQPISSAADHSGSPALINQEQPIEHHKPPHTDRKHPGYLQGKNPYGQVLDRIEHPYREPRTTVTEDKKITPTISELGSLPDTHSVSEPRPQASLPAHKPIDEQPHQQSRQVPFNTKGPVSVRSAKDFFETRSSQHSQCPPFPPSVPAPSAKPSTRIQESVQPSNEGDIHVPSAEVIHDAAKEAPDKEPPPPRPTESSDIVELVEPTSSSLGDETHGSATDVPARNTPSPPQVLVSDYGHSESGIQKDSIGRRKSTNVFVDPPRGAQFLGSERVAKKGSEQVAASPAPPSSEKTTKSTAQSRTSDKIVRRPTACKSIAAAETSEGGISRSSPPQTEGRRAKSCRDVRKAFEEHRYTDQTPRKYCRLCGAALTRNKSNKPTDHRRRAEDVVSPGLSHDGASSPTRRSNPASYPVTTANIGIEAQYEDIEVPEHVDNRQGYGRRVTQDFGFPGARIRRHDSTKKRPLQDPGKWVKRMCGHFSYMGRDELREQAQARNCQQCLARPSSHQSQSGCLRHAREQGTSRSSTYHSPEKKSLNIDSRNPSFHQRGKQGLPTDHCGDMFAKDLGKIIDRILEEHASTLQDVINKIKLSQPCFGSGKRMSDDLDEQCQTNNVGLDPVRVVHLSDMNRFLAFPMFPPKAAEKLNVGAHGQLGPNLNDYHSQLRHSIKTLSDLVHLVNSAADDFGLDLEQGPTQEDEEKFHNAPYEAIPCVPISTHPTMSRGSGEETSSSSSYSEDPWVQQTPRHRTLLSGAREQYLKKLDSIAGSTSLQSRGDGDFECFSENTHRNSIGPSRNSTQLDGDSFSAATEEVPRMSEEMMGGRTGRPIMRTSTPSTSSTASECLPGFEDTLPGEI